MNPTDELVARLLDGAQELSHEDRSTIAAALESLSARVKELERDAAMLNFLEREMIVEEECIARGEDYPRSLFRRNTPITRAIIDAAMSNEKGAENADPAQS